MYVLKSSSGDVVGRSATPIDARGGQWRSADTVWLSPVPGDGSYVDQVEEVPASITPRQARLMLLRSGKLGAVMSALAALPQGQRQEAEIEWEYATQIERTHPLINVLSAAIGLSDDMLDQLFIQASKL